MEFCFFRVLCARFVMFESLHIRNEITNLHADTIKTIFKPNALSRSLLRSHKNKS